MLIQIRNHRRSLQQTKQSTAASEISRTARCSPCATAQINYRSLNRITAGGYHSDGLSVRSMSRCAPVGERAAPRHERWPNQTLAARFRAATSCVRNNQAFFRPLALPMSSTGKVHWNGPNHQWCIVLKERKKKAQRRRKIANCRWPDNKSVRHCVWGYDWLHFRWLPVGFGRAKHWIDGPMLCTHYTARRWAGCGFDRLMCDGRPGGRPRRRTVSWVST